MARAIPLLTIAELREQPGDENGKDGNILPFPNEPGSVTTAILKSDAILCKACERVGLVPFRT